MRCPLRMKAFDQPDTCDPEGALRMYNYINGTEACAVAVIAMMTEGENNPYRIGNNIDETSQEEGKVVNI